MGYSVREVSLPYTGYSLTCYYILAESDIASNMARSAYAFHKYTAMSARCSPACKILRFRYDGVRYGFRTPNDDAQQSFSELLAVSRTRALNDTVKRRIFAGNFYNIRE